MMTRTEDWGTAPVTFVLPRRHEFGGKTPILCSKNLQLLLTRKKQSAIIAETDINYFQNDPREHTTMQSFLQRTD
jgi:hypothetical protein